MGLRLKKKRSYLTFMKKILILLTALALVATPAMAGTHLEKSKGQKHVTKHAVTKHQKKQLARHEKKQAKKKFAKRYSRKHKVAV